MKKKLLLYNPASGGRPSLEDISRSCYMFSEHGWNVIPHPTVGPKTASTIIENFKDEIDGVIVWGGDGTINEALPALVDSNLFLAILKGGTANVLANELGIPDTISKAVQSIVAGRIKKVTVGRAGNQYFISMLGVGFDALVSQTVSPVLKGFLGKAAYALEAVKQVFKYDFPAAKFITASHQWKAPFGIVCNVRHYGGSFIMAPSASLEKSTFDLCLFTECGPLAYIKYLWHLLWKTHTRCSTVLYREVNSIEIQGNENILFQLDGEVAGHLPIVVKSKSNSLNLVFPNK